MGGLLFLKGQIVRSYHFAMKTDRHLAQQIFSAARDRPTQRTPVIAFGMGKMCRMKIFKPNLHIGCFFLFPLFAFTAPKPFLFETHCCHTFILLVIAITVSILIVGVGWMLTLKQTKAKSKNRDYTRPKEIMIGAPTPIRLCVQWITIRRIKNRLMLLCAHTHTHHFFECAGHAPHTYFPPINPVFRCIIIH